MTVLNPRFHASHRLFVRSSPLTVGSITFHTMAGTAVLGAGWSLSILVNLAIASQKKQIHINHAQSSKPPDSDQHLPEAIEKCILRNVR